MSKTEKWLSKSINNILLSYPRSGNTWVRYCIEYITGKPTNGACGSSIANSIPHHIKPICCLTGMGINCDQDPIAHKFHKINFPVDENDVGLIVVVRNYKESVIRHKCYDNRSGSFGIDNWKLKFKDAVLGESDKVDYVKILLTYDKWKGRKILIYYEDIISNPASEIGRLAKFFGVDFDADKFMKDIDLHREKSVSVYKSWSFSSTKGKNDKFHSEKFDKNDLLWMDKTVESRNSYIFEEYLKRYKE